MEMIERISDEIINVVYPDGYRSTFHVEEVQRIQVEREPKTMVGESAVITTFEGTYTVDMKSGGDVLIPYQLSYRTLPELNKPLHHKN